MALLINNSNRMTTKYFYFFLVISSLQLTVAAQQPTDKSSVEIVSEYKPGLKNLNKIPFTASPAMPDTTLPRLQYNIPNQNLTFALTPGLLRPLDLSIDQVQWQNRNFVKLGYGSYNTPYLQTGLSLGDGVTNGFNMYGRYLSSDGKRAYQDYRDFSAQATGFYKTPVFEWSAGAGVHNYMTHKYGFEPETLIFPKDSVRQDFMNLILRTGIRNVTANNAGIDYSPELKMSFFNDNHQARETGFAITAPFTKKINEAFGAKLSLGFETSGLHKPGFKNISTSNFYIAPAVTYQSGSFSLHGGIRPSWDKGEFVFFPDLYAQVGTKNQQFTLLGGFSGYIKPNSYRSLVYINPWIWSPDTLYNTRITEMYGGIKGSLGNHFTYSGKIGLSRIKNQPLFLNDGTPGTDGKSFTVLRETNLTTRTLSGEIGYNVAERFSLLTSVTTYAFSGLKDNIKPWGLSPMELKGSIRYKVIKELWLKADALGMGGAQFLSKTGSNVTMKDAFDLNVGAEATVYKGLGLWLQFNNIFNQPYQRWNQYPVYGFNFLGGIVYSFPKTK